MEPSPSEAGLPELPTFPSGMMPPPSKRVWRPFRVHKSRWFYRNGFLMMADFEVDPVSIDVSHLVRRNVASLYSSLVTRPTGQAVRLAIENVLAEAVGPISLSIIDLSQVTVIDFSCADEVVAKLLLRFLGEERPSEAFFIFRGLKELHRDPIEVVLERHALAAVAETESGAFELLGSTSRAEEKVWAALERRGGVGETDADDIIPLAGAREVLDALVGRRVVFHHPTTGQYSALSALLGEPAES